MLKSKNTWIFDNYTDVPVFNYFMMQNTGNSGYLFVYKQNLNDRIKVESDLNINEPQPANDDTKQAQYNIFASQQNIELSDTIINEFFAAYLKIKEKLTGLSSYEKLRLSRVLNSKHKPDFVDINELCMRLERVLDYKKDILVNKYFITMDEFDALIEHAEYITKQKTNKNGK